MWYKCANLTIDGIYFGDPRRQVGTVEMGCSLPDACSGISVPVVMVPAALAIKVFFFFFITLKPRVE